MNAFRLAERPIGLDYPCFIIAEAGVNHNGDVTLAHRLIDAAAEAGVDAIKFQTFDPERVVAPEAAKAAYQVETTGKDGSQLDMLAHLVLPATAYRELQAHATRRGLIFLSTPFDESSADFLEQLDMPAFKISSGDLTNTPFLAYIAAKKRPMLVSTGMATLDETALAVDTIRASGNPPLALFHCVSNYPAQPADCNLRAMDTMRSKFDLPVGWSDHTEGVEIALAAVARGANLLEKHLTLDRTLPGPDHRASLEPDELRGMVSLIRRVESALGNGIKQPALAEQAIALIGRRSLYWSMSLAAGTIVAAHHFRALRPGNGVSPMQQASFIGSQLRRTVTAGQQVSPDDFVIPS